MKGAISTALHLAGALALSLRRVLGDAQLSLEAGMPSIIAFYLLALAVWIAWSALRTMLPFSVDYSR
jgi:hypothetical protein